MRAFAISTRWMFDLDNTLYPASCRLFDQIAVRMNEMIVARMGLTLAEATKLRHGYFKKYGTTLRGLMIEHGWEPHEFLEYVHEIDYALSGTSPGPGRSHCPACRAAS